MIMDAATAIAIATALGLGTILASIVNSILNRNKNRADTSGVFVQTSEKLVEMLRSQAEAESSRAQEWRARFEKTDAELRTTNVKLDLIQHDLADQQDRIRRMDLVMKAEKQWAIDHGLNDAPVLSWK